MNIISISLYGKNPFYCVGAIENSKLAKIIYPGWVVRVYAGLEVPHDVISALEANGCEIVYSPHDINENVDIMDIGNGRPVDSWSTPSKFGMFWRFLAVDDPVAEYVIFRDADSRLNVREQAAVTQWICSGKIMHTMHDNPCHHWHILGGMCGIKCRSISMWPLLRAWKYTGEYGNDCKFLSETVWPLVKHSALAHGNGNGRIPFPAHAKYGGFVGERVEI